MKHAVGAFWILILTITGMAALPSADTANHIGEATTVRGTVVQVRTIPSGMTFLNFDQPHPKSPFTAVVPANATGFGDLKALEGTEAEVTGTITLHKGRPQIVLEGPENLVATGGSDPAETPEPTPAAPPVESPASPPLPESSPETPKSEAVATPQNPQNSANQKSDQTVFQVPLSSEERKLAGKSPAGVAPEEATVSFRFPQGFDATLPQKVLVVFATDDGGGAHVKALPRFAAIANKAGWVAIAANGPVAEEKLSPEWNAAMIFAGLRALKEKYPAAAGWDYYVAGNSGGALRASMMAGALLSEDYNVKGAFMGGAGGEQFSTGQAIFRAPRSALRDLPVFLSHGTKDALVSPQMADATEKAIGAAGIRTIHRDSYEGGHGMNDESLERALSWFSSGPK